MIQGSKAPLLLNPLVHQGYVMTVPDFEGQPGAKLAAKVAAARAFYGVMSVINWHSIDFETPKDPDSKESRKYIAEYEAGIEDRLEELLFDITSDDPYAYDAYATYKCLRSFEVLIVRTCYMWA